MAQRPLFAAAPLVIRLPPTCLGKRWDVAGVSPSLPRTLGNRCSSWSPASGDCGDSKAAGARSLSVSLYLWPCLPPGTASCCSPSHRSHTGSPPQRTRPSPSCLHCHPALRPGRGKQQTEPSTQSPSHPPSRPRWGSGFRLNRPAGTWPSGSNKICHSLFQEYQNQIFGKKMI